MTFIKTNLRKEKGETMTFIYVTIPCQHVGVCYNGK